MEILRLGLLSILVSTSYEFRREPKKIPLPLLCVSPLPPGQGVPVNESVVLQASDVPVIRVCNLTIATSSRSRKLLINFLKFNIGVTCDDGTTLEVFDYHTGNSVTGKLCGNTIKKRVFQPDARVISLVYTPTNDTKYEPLLEILLTSYTEGKGGLCDQGEFQCANKICIAKDLVCNGYNECSDNSDEENCGHQPSDTSITLSWWVWLVIGVGIVILLAAGAFAAYMVVRRVNSRGYKERL